MKKTFFTLLFLLLISCSSNKKVNDVAAFEFDNAWHWICTYSSESTEEDRIAYVERYSNPEQTSFFYFYPDTAAVGYFASTAFDFNTMKHNILTNPRATEGLYKLPKDETVYTDGLWLLDQTNKK